MVHVVLRGHVGHHWRGRGWAPKLVVKGVATPFAAPVTLDVTKGMKKMRFKISNITKQRGIKFETTTLSYGVVFHVTTLQSMMNTKLSKQMF